MSDYYLSEDELKRINTKPARVFVMGDIHGAYKALVQCLQRAKFDYENDVLIQLGDIADGWTEVYECVEELLKIKNLITIRGNHDEWFQQWIDTTMHPQKWRQGGFGTLKSYGFNCLGREWDKFKIHYNGDGAISNLIVDDVPRIHQEFFQHQINYYIDDKNRLFVHGGFNRHAPFKGQPEYIYYWDRDLWNAALGYESMVDKDDGMHGKNKNKFKTYDKFDEIFVGHTATVNWGTDQPMKAANIWNLDTGAGFRGKLTIMDVDTHEYWQSDDVKELYYDEEGRN